MTTDLTQRLREEALTRITGDALLREAAARIADLETETATLRAQLADRDVEVERLKADTSAANAAREIAEIRQGTADARGQVAEEACEELKAELASLREMPGEAIVEALLQALMPNVWPMLTDEEKERDRSEMREAMAKHVARPIRAQEREACATLADQVYIHLISSGSPCPCGNGRIPTTACREAVDAYAAAIRKGAAP